MWLGVDIIIVLVVSRDNRPQGPRAEQQKLQKALNGWGGGCGGCVTCVGISGGVCGGVCHSSRLSVSVCVCRLGNSLALASKERGLAPVGLVAYNEVREVHRGVGCDTSLVGPPARAGGG